jgi:hypothetical protein
VFPQKREVRGMAIAALTGMMQRWILLFAMLCACADPQQVSYENSLDREIQRFAFHRPIAEVWPELVGLLGEHGFVVHEAQPVEDRTVISDLRLDAGSSRTGYRAVVRVIRVDRSSYMVRIDRQYDSGNGSVDMESPNTAGRPTQVLIWSLIERVEPATATKILERLRVRN